ncbi:hypothetical protein [Streptomyces benahoarensis]|uniref:Uncharacterized protein n=1 Tax=Streptomyces benahoarensis TaxID=2595054 RepID=A0A553ZIW4_9ACTN|nr:hypothetical protein [Streptomyces benahoarensis]TSB31884.1 hypothetical protein FNJ62_04275 [Streptomyces benahoarensis]TSB41327.1 hypothetical protein FNZ23_12705 [Streptomyces benahoarensis]
MPEILSMSLCEGDDLEPMTDHDAVTGWVFNQFETGDTGALTETETFDWQAIEAEHSDHARAVLAGQGIEWNPDTGSIACPAGMEADQVAAAWESARDKGNERVLDLIEEIRRGMPGAEGGRTAGDAWVLPL